MNPTPITNLFLGNQSQLNNAQPETSEGLSGTFENVLSETINSQNSGLNQGLSNEFKEFFSLLSIFWNPVPTQSESLTQEENANNIQLQTENISSDVSSQEPENAQIENNPKAFDGFISDLQIILSIIQTILGSYTSDSPNETTNITNIEENTNPNIISNNLNNQYQEELITDTSKNTTKQNNTGDQNNQIINISTNSETDKNKNEENILNTSKTDKHAINNQNSINLLEEQQKEKNSNSNNLITNNNIAKNLSKIEIKDFDISISTFSLKNHSTSQDQNNRQIKNGQLTSNNIMALETEPEKTEFFGIDLNEIYGNKARFSTEKDNNKIEGEFTKIFGSFNQDNKGNIDKQIDFEFKTIHISSSTIEKNKTINLNNNQPINDKEDILIIDYNTNEKQDNNQLSLKIEQNNNITTAYNQGQISDNKNSNIIETINTNQNDKTILSQVTDGLNQVIKLNKTRAILHLNPPELGSVKVNISIDNNHHIQANFIADHPETKHILEANLQHLREHLNQNGFSLAQVNIDLGGNFGNTNNQFYDNSNNGSQQQFLSTNQSADSIEAISQTSNAISDDGTIHIVI